MCKFGTAKSEIDSPDSNEIDREPVQLGQISGLKKHLQQSMSEKQ